MKKVVAYVVESHGYSERRACKLTRQHRSTQRKVLTSDPLLELRQRMHEIVATRVRYGYRRVHILLRREGWDVGRNRVYRQNPRGRPDAQVQAAAPPEDGDAS